MIIRHRFFQLIHILCCAATIHGILLNANDAETCNLLCVQCNGSAVFADDHCECNFADGSDKDSGAECIRRIQREIQAIELNMLSEDPTDEERNVRSILKYRRRLRPGDAEKVAQYFINGGPAAGHSHFVRAFNAAYDSADSATNSFSGVLDERNPEDGFHGVISPVSSNICDSPLYMVSESTPYASPTMHGAETYSPTLRTVNPAITNELYDLTSPLGSIIHPHLPHVLFRAATFPAHVLHHVLHPRLYHHVYHRGIVRSTNLPSDTSDTAIVGQPCENNGDSTTSNLPTAGNNANKPAEQHVLGLTDSSQYPYLTRVPLYLPTQYQHLPYQYNPYYSNPFMNMFHPTSNDYVIQPATRYMPEILDPLTSASNPQSSCRNTNTEQKSGILTNDKSVYSNDGTEKSDDATRNNIPKEEKKTEKNGINKS